MNHLHRLTAPALALALGLALASCGSKGANAGPTISASDRQEAQSTFQMICVSCHGNTGNGDGPGAIALNPKPRQFKDPTWQASVTDEQIKKTITNGGAAVGKSPLMPAQPQLKSKAGVLDGLVAIIRGFSTQ